MTGVEILATEEVVVDTCFNYTCFLITLGIIFSFFIIIGIIASSVENDCFYFYAFILSGLILGVLIGYSIGAANEIPTDYETHYKVTIDDTVTMKEFNEKYEVLDQDDKIYVVRER